MGWGSLACAAGELATAAVTVLAGLAAAAVLVVRELRREPPPGRHDA